MATSRDSRRWPEIDRVLRSGTITSKIRYAFGVDTRNDVDFADLYDAIMHAYRSLRIDSPWRGAAPPPPPSENVETFANIWNAALDEYDRRKAARRG